MAVETKDLLCSVLQCKEISPSLWLLLCPAMMSHHNCPHWNQAPAKCWTCCLYQLVQPSLFLVRHAASPADYGVQECACHHCLVKHMQHVTAHIKRPKLPALTWPLSFISCYVVASKWWHDRNIRVVKDVSHNFPEPLLMSLNHPFCTTVKN